MRLPSINKGAELARLKRDIAAHLREVDRVRLELFRRELQLTVNSATPLLTTYDEPLAVASALAALRPSRRWPRFDHSLLGKNLRHFWSAQVGGYVVSPKPSGRRTSTPRRFRRAHLPQSGRRVLELIVDEGCVKLALRLGGCAIATAGGQVSIHLAELLSETLSLAVVGRPLGDLVDYPLFAGCDYPILSVDAEANRTIVTARTGTAPFEMPWPHLLERA